MFVFHFIFLFVCTILKVKMDIENKTSKSVKTTTIEEDMRSLEEVEDV